MVESGEGSEGVERAGGGLGPTMGGVACGNGNGVLHHIDNEPVISTSTYPLQSCLVAMDCFGPDRFHYDNLL